MPDDKHRNAVETGARGVLAGCAGEGGESAMSEPYYVDDSVTLHHGHDLDVLRTLPDGSVDCVVTSPPYFGLRDYGQDGQRGLETSPAEYVAGMVDVFRDIRRVLAEHGTCWLNLGDTYASSVMHNDNEHNGNRDGTSDAKARAMGTAMGRQRRRVDRPAKNLLGIPWRVALALQDDGWTLRNDIIWAKPNAMPESVTDRLSTRHEHVFLLTKSQRYWFDLDPIREPLTHPDALDGSRVFGGVNKAESLTTGSSARRTGNRYGSARPGENREQGDDRDAANPRGRNPGDVWSLTTSPFAEAHFAVMPLALAERCVLAGCKPGGVVLDPYSGSGTTGLAATKHGRRYVGIDLSRDYLDLSLRTRLAQGVLEEAPA